MNLTVPKIAVEDAAAEVKWIYARAGQPVTRHQLLFVLWCPRARVYVEARAPLSGVLRDFQVEVGAQIPTFGGFCAGRIEKSETGGRNGIP